MITSTHTIHDFVAVWMMMESVQTNHEKLGQTYECSNYFGKNNHEKLGKICECSNYFGAKIECIPQWQFKKTLAI